MNLILLLKLTNVETGLHKIAHFETPHFQMGAFETEVMPLRARSMSMSSHFVVSITDFFPARPSPRQSLPSLLSMLYPLLPRLSSTLLAELRVSSLLILAVIAFYVKRFN